MTKTKKVGMAGRFGAHYGSRVRHNWLEVMERSKGIQKCPRCETRSRNMREFIGVWHCKKCGARWTGGAWDPVTVRGRESARIAIRIAHEEEAKKEVK